MSRGTRHHTVRVDDGLWEEAQAVAFERGEILSAIIREALRQYVSNHVNESRKPCPSL